MPQIAIPAAFYRGGTSKGLFLHARHCPAERGLLDRVLLAALGSPDPYGRQLDGMGGGTSSLSKAAIIGPATHPDADVDYTFAQVAVDRAVVDWGANCGNLASAVGPFAIDEALVAASDGDALVRIHQVNTAKLIHARFPVRGGRAVTGGDTAIDGVAGTGARITLDFLRPGGSFTRGLLPTGHPVDRVDLDGRSIELSLVDASNPVAFVAADALGLAGVESPDAIEADPTLMARLDRLRRLAAVAMGLAERPEAAGLANPKIALIAAPAPFTALGGRQFAAGSHDIAVRMLSMERAHRAVTLTGAMCLAAACGIDGTLPARRVRTGADASLLRVGHASGVIEVGATVRALGSGWDVASTTVVRTARRLMQGEVLVPDLAAWMP